MPSFSETKILNYTARQLYDLVLDVKQYPKFVPWCEECKVLSIKEREIIAEVTAAFGPFKKSYTSLIKHGTYDENYFVKVEQLTGPFEFLDTEWVFEKHDKFSSKINFNISFEFESNLVNGLISGIFENATKEMIIAFEQRAKEIYEAT